MKKKITSLAMTLLLGLFSWNAAAQTQVTVAGSVSGDGNYSTLGAAIAAVPLTGQSGNNITVVINASTTETGTITIGNGNWATLKIYPSANTLICNAANIALSGAKNVTIDGRVNATGTPVVGATESLTLTSTSTTLPVISFDNDAQSNTVKYCTIKIGAIAATTTGGIYIGATASASNGNGLNVIDHNKITSSGATYPLYTIYATGITSYPNKENQITNNEFTNFMVASPPAGKYPIGIYILGNAGGNINDKYTISGNSMYGGTFTVTTGGNRYFMEIGALGNGGSHTITNNYIGGSSAQCGGGKMTKNPATNSHFQGIILTTSATGTSFVQNNTIKNITWPTWNANQNFTAISVSGTGDATISGNIIGDNSTSGLGTTASIIHTQIGNNTGTFNGISISTIGTVSCVNNQIGSIKSYNQGTGSTGAVNMNGIFKSGAGTATIINNLIGSTTVPNSITDSIYNTTTLYAQTITGINWTGTGTGTISNNTIANLTNKTNTGAVNGINLNGLGSTVSLDGNLVHTIGITGATTAIISGIICTLGSNTVTNNIVKFGDNNSAELRGISDVGGTSQLYFNTVYLSGAPTTLSLNSAGLYSSTTTARNYKNNILVNTRSNDGAGGTHFAMNITTTGSISVDGNNYISNGAFGAMLGSYNGTSTSTLPIVVTEVSSKNVNPTFANAGGTLATDYITSNTSLTGVTGTGVTTDYAGTIRTAPTMGAYFIPTVVQVNSSTTDPAGLTAASQLEVAAGAELTFTTSPNISKIILAPTAKLTMGSNSITAPNGVVLQSDATGTATLTGENAVSNATVQQYISSGRNWYISPSVSAGTASMLSLGDSVVVWNEVSKIWEKVTGSLITGRGYIQTAASGHGTSGTVNFTGTTNSGDVAITVSRTELGSSRGFNLVGNPYPSYLKWTGTNGFLAETTNDSISTSFWLRTKNTLGDYVFTTYNGSSHEVVGGTEATTLLNEYIPPMQAFWIRVNANTAVSTHNVGLTFKNNMRFHGVGDNNIFKAPKQSNRRRLRLQVSNGTYSDESLLYFDANAQNSFDNYDSPKMFNNVATKPEIFTNVGSEKLVINGMNEIPYNTEIPVGFLVGEAGNFTLSSVELSNFESGTRILLKDKLYPSTEFELAEGLSYNFSAQPTTASTDRFSLLFRAPGVTTGVGKTSKPYAQVFVNAANQITIIATEKSNYAIYNAMGQLIENGALNTERETRNMKLNSGVYVVKVNNQSTKVIIK